MAYVYRAMVVHPDCLIHRPVSFKDERFMDWWQAGREVFKHIYSQTCVRCGKPHLSRDFVMIELERGEAARIDGHMQYIRVLPPRLEEETQQQELPLHG